MCFLWLCPLNRRLQRSGRNRSNHIRCGPGSRFNDRYRRPIGSLWWAGHIRVIKLTGFTAGSDYSILKFFVTLVCGTPDADLTKRVAQISCFNDHYRL